MAFQNLPSQRRLLDAIAAGESTGYDVLYGGGRFGSYADHPRQAIPITSGPNVGKTSSAAGRYQFLGSTWDETARELGLKDFSPENQDAGAWHLAAKTYNAKTGRDLLTDLESGNTQDVAGALKGVWTSIPGGIEPNKATAGFDGRLGGAPGLLESPSAPTDQPAQPQGLLAGLTSESPIRAQSQPGLLGGLQQQQPEMTMPEMPQAQFRRKQIDLSKLQAMIKQARRASWG